MAKCEWAERRVLIWDPATFHLFCESKHGNKRFSSAPIKLTGTDIVTGAVIAAQKMRKALQIKAPQDLIKASCIFYHTL